LKEAPVFEEVEALWVKDLADAFLRAVKLQSVWCERKRQVGSPEGLLKILSSHFDAKKIRTN